MKQGVILFAISLIALIFLFSFLFLRLFLSKGEKKKKLKQEKKEEIEILEVEPSSSFTKQVLKEVSSDTLDLDSLFQTMSINVIKDDPDFDFDLIRGKSQK